MDSAIARQLQDKLYEKRKAAAHELEKHIRDYHNQGEEKRISQIIDHLVELFATPSNPLHVRNGGLIGLAGTAIALLTDIASYMERFIEPLLACFSDSESRIRYFSAECLYNIAKVSKGEILVYFNPIFDALSKLSDDVELSVKNGAELLDRLMKDIVAESASVYVPQYPETIKISQMNAQDGVLIPRPGYNVDSEVDGGVATKAFSLAHFIPLLSDRISVVSPFTRSFLVSWVTVLDSIPELELVTYLPEFLDGLIKYLSDPTQDVKVVTENLLADFLREVRDITMLQRRQEDRRKELEKGRSEKSESLDTESTKEDRELGAWVPGQGVYIDHNAIIEILILQLDPETPEVIQQTALHWISTYLQFNPSDIIPFTPTLIPLILPNLAHHVDGIRNSARGCNSLLWSVIRDLEIKESEATLPPSPTHTRKSSVAQVPDSTTVNRSNVASPVPSQNLPQPQTQTQTRPRSTYRDVVDAVQMNGLPAPEQGQLSTLSQAPVSTLPSSIPLPPRLRSQTSPLITQAPLEPSTAQQDGALVAPGAASSHSQPIIRPVSPLSVSTGTGTFSGTGQAVNNSPEDLFNAQEPFNYAMTVSALTEQFLGEHEDTRIAALKWLIMLHQKNPKKILAMDDATFPALLKILSDSSEEVIKHDLLLLAQISSTSTETDFRSFMIKLLELFSTDRRLLDTRGSLIIRQLCLSLQTERIYKSFAEILEKEEDLEFAGHMIQTLNLILITSPELADLRKRLKTVENRQDGQVLFISLYRSWCHNAVAVFSLCLLAQAYEHASNLLQIFAELEITVQLLVQIDRLVQLIESPIFTYLRLQLLEPEKHPYLYKCLYGLLMLLPQSTAFGSLRNRLNAVNSMGFMHLTPKTSVSVLSSARGKVSSREDIKWQELFSHFRQVQSKHEKARRASLGLGYEGGSFVAGFLPESSAKSGIGTSTAAVGPAVGPGTSPTRPGMRRKVTGGVEIAPNSTNSIGPGGNILSRSTLGLSPLNPKTQQPRSPSLLASALNIGGKGGDLKGGNQARKFSSATVVPNSSSVKG